MRWFKWPLIIDRDDRTHRRHVVKSFGGEHWNPDAAMAGRIRRDRWAAMDGDTINDVTGVIERAERANPQAVDFSRDDEAAARCVRALGNAAIAV